MTVRRLLLLALVVVALTGCAAERHLLMAHGGGIDVTVDDRTGWTLGASVVEPVPASILDDWSGGSVKVRNVDDAVLQVAWTGGGCQEPATMLVTGKQDALAVRIHLGKPCMTQEGVLRVLRLTFDRAIDAANVDGSVVDTLPD